MYATVTLLAFLSLFFLFSVTATTEIYTILFVGSVRCVQETGYQRRVHGQLRTVFIVTIIKNIPELVMPYMKMLMKQKFKEEDETPVLHQFSSIDNQITKQISLEPYAANKEVDGTIFDYLELIVQFGFLNLFGLVFPLSFLLAFANNVAEIQVDKLKLKNFSRRPIPTGAKSIGIWFIILDIITFFFLIYKCRTLSVYKWGSRGQQI
eukprot:TRINITY_DN6368_c0_g1_i3.p3 TRINITY_DN6368_c0_g1~~TRINITY_DN6368_c0_g1_i3.p3  ORF type:complete len:215 (-),score=29.02 TRINITY_DN6368_c0_g1_i3:376-999(-)